MPFDTQYFRSLAPLWGLEPEPSTPLRRYGASLLRGWTQGELRRLTLKRLARAGLVPVDLQYRLGVVPRPHCAYGLQTAAIEAKMLGYSGITAIEFGVAGGNGLLTLARQATHLSKSTGVAIELVGFDTGTGMPEPVDHRDVPQWWEEGFFPMDEQALRKQLDGRTELVLGDVHDTIPAFLDSHGEALRECPIGFVEFDVDYWSSTLAAFDVFRDAPDLCLPRVTCYFATIRRAIEDEGELLAIADFNREPHGRRIRHPYDLRSLVPFKPAWAEQIFRCYLFDHPRYAERIHRPGEFKRLDLSPQPPARGPGRPGTPGRR